MCVLNEITYCSEASFFRASGSEMLCQHGVPQGSDLGVLPFFININNYFSFFFCSKLNKEKPLTFISLLSFIPQTWN